MGTHRTRRTTRKPAYRPTFKGACEAYVSALTNANKDRDDHRTHTDAHAARPLQRVDIVRLSTNIMVVDQEDGVLLGRPTAALCVDHLLHYPLGFEFDYGPPTVHGDMRSLYRSIQAKGDVMKLYGCTHNWTAFGVPHAVALRHDVGTVADYRAVYQACGALGITVLHSSAGPSRACGDWERLTEMLAAEPLPAIRAMAVPVPQSRDDTRVPGPCVFEDDLRGLVTRVLVDVFA
jgi:hypothetical protein